MRLNLTILNRLKPSTSELWLFERGCIKLPHGFSPKFPVSIYKITPFVTWLKHLFRESFWVYATLKSSHNYHFLVCQSNESLFHNIFLGQHTCLNSSGTQGSWQWMLFWSLICVNEEKPDSMVCDNDLGTQLAEYVNNDVFKLQKIQGILFNRFITGQSFYITGNGDV